jgi:hypothetical protein
MAFAPEKSADVSPELIAQAVEAAFAKRDTMVKARFAEIEVSFSAVIARLERIELALHKKNKAPQTSKKKVAA